MRSGAKKTIDESEKGGHVHMRHIVPIMAAFAVATTGISFAAYNQAKDDAVVKTYYATLANQCFEVADSGCCIASVQRMQAYGYFQAVGGSCPDGFERNALRCASSFSWCVPDDPMPGGRFVKGEEVRTTGLVVENITDKLPVGGPGYMRLAELDGGGIVTVYYSHGEAPCPGLQNTAVGASLTPGDRVDVFGQALSSSSVTVCPSQAYSLVNASASARSAAVHNADVFAEPVQ